MVKARYIAWSMSSSTRAQSGQAAVESAITLPLVIFMLLGTLQLFMVLQARLLAQYSAYKAVRAGSLTHGSCESMTHAAIAALLPSITRTDSPERLGEAFLSRRNNRYAPALEAHDGPILELVRESPDPATIRPPAIEDNAFDLPGELRVLTIRMLYWYRLKIPFADWVIGRAVLAYWGLRDYRAVNPLMPTQRDAGWRAEAVLTTEAWPGGAVPSRMLGWADQGQYLLPIRVTSSMRMMVPPRQSNFATAECPL